MAVNEVMEEIEDHLDSDEDDQAYLVTKNSSTGGNEVPVSSTNAEYATTDYTKGGNEYNGYQENQYYGQEGAYTDANYNYQA